MHKQNEKFNKGNRNHPEKPNRNSVTEEQAV